jgi:hypothetical protein
MPEERNSFTSAGTIFSRTVSSFVITSIEGGTTTRPYVGMQTIKKKDLIPLALPLR